MNKKLCKEWTDEDISILQKMVEDNETYEQISKHFATSIYYIYSAMKKYNIKRKKKPIEDLENEIWKDIKDYEDYYQVSNMGRVRSLPRWIYYSDGRKYFYDGVLLKQKHDHSGYCQVELTINSKLKTCKVHRLVAEAFIPNPNNLPQINHKDEDKDNNCVDNLEWCDSDYNSKYGTKIERGHETLIKTRGKPVIFTKLSTGEKFIFPAINIGIKELDLDPRTVCRILKKEPYYKTIKGYSVEYV